MQQPVTILLQLETANETTSEHSTVIRNSQWNNQRPFCRNSPYNKKMAQKTALSYKMLDVLNPKLLKKTQVVQLQARSKFILYREEREEIVRMAGRHRTSIKHQDAELFQRQKSNFEEQIISTFKMNESQL